MGEAWRRQLQSAPGDGPKIEWHVFEVIHFGLKFEGKTIKKAVDHTNTFNATRRDVTWIRGARLTALLLVYVTWPAELKWPASSMYTALT